VAAERSLRVVAPGMRVPPGTSLTDRQSVCEN
jgi:hypothetical protein